jgi:ribonuclease M5
VEGIDADILRRLLSPYAADAEPADRGGITKGDLYELGLSGGKDSSELREQLENSLGLPKGLSANALLDLLNSLYGREEFIRLAESLRSSQQ